jgi:hypothetical protein
MKRMLICTFLVGADLLTTAPVFAHDWDNPGWRREQHEAAVRREIARERHDAWLRQRSFAHRAEVARDMRRRDEWDWRR